MMCSLNGPPMLLGFLVVASLLASAFGQECSQPPEPANGRVRLRNSKRVANFHCNVGFKLVGKARSICLRGQWDSLPPLCVASGCPELDPPHGGMVTLGHHDGIASFTCRPGYKLIGNSSQLICDGVRWNGTRPSCQVAMLNPPLQCSFSEESETCGWTQEDTAPSLWTFKSPLWTPPSQQETVLSLAQPTGDQWVSLFSPIFAPTLTPGCAVLSLYTEGNALLEVFEDDSRGRPVLRQLIPPSNGAWKDVKVNVSKLIERFQVILRARTEDSEIIELSHFAWLNGNCLTNSRTTTVTTTTTPSSTSPPFPITITPLDRDRNRPFSRDLTTERPPIVASPQGSTLTLQPEITSIRPQDEQASPLISSSGHQRARTLSWTPYKDRTQSLRNNSVKGFLPWTLFGIGLVLVVTITGTAVWWSLWRRRRQPYVTGTSEECRYLPKDDSVALGSGTSSASGNDSDDQR